MSPIRKAATRTHGARGSNVSWAVVLVVAAALAVAGAVVWALLNVVGFLHNFEVHAPSCDKTHHLIYRPQPMGKSVVLIPTCVEGAE